MSEEACAGEEIARLERLVGDDSAAAGFAALAEAHRRAGRAERAEAIARAGLERRPDAVAGRVALGLALLDRGRLAEARAELERALEEVPDHPRAQAALGRAPAEAPSPLPEAEAFLGSVPGSEIEDALDRATWEPPSSLTPDRVAEAAVEEAEWGTAEDAADEGPEEEIPVATRTVADLLERQGDPSGARNIRSSLAREERERVLATLERWLDNLRRGHA